MKINGVDLKTRRTTGTVVLPRGDGEPITLTVHGLPLGSEEKLRRLFPPPRPPKKSIEVGKTPKGAPPLLERDEQGKVVYREDRLDPDFVALEHHHNTIWNTYFCYMGLRPAGEVEFTTKYPAEETAESLGAFLALVYDEMAEAGFLMGDMLIIMKKVLELSNIGQGRIEEVARDFLSSRRDR